MSKLVKTTRTKAQPKKTVKAAAPKGPQYNPKKLYRWSPEDVFPVKGTEFGILFNTLLKEKAELISKLELINMMETKLKEAVESGLAKEIPEEEIRAAQEKAQAQVAKK
jgi:hypothetical protein